MDTLTVYLSGDDWDGDPQAILRVNGQQVGNTLDVSAVHGSDDTQAFTVTGDFGTDPQASVTFVNDASNGTVSGDRNLYVDGFDYDGVSQTGLKQELSYNSTYSADLTSTAPQAERASDFLDSIGVDVHLDYTDTSYGDVQRVENAVAYLGPHLLRVGAPTAQTLPEMQALAATGVKFDVIVPSASTTSGLSDEIAAIDTIAPDVAAIEGPNEVNLTSGFSWNGVTGDAAAAAYQAALYAAVEADPKLRDDAVYALTLGGTGAQGFQALGDLSASATNGNDHVYFSNGAPPYQTIQYNIGLSDIDAPGLAPVITETNYNTATAVTGGVNDAVQASYDLDLLMDATKQGVAATYLYELLDQFSDPSNANTEEHYGLFNSDGTPKPAATAIHNLTSILGDSGQNASTFTTGSLAYSVSGLPASGDSLLLQKSDGSYDIVVWAEPEIWNVSNQTEVAATPRTVQVTLPDAASGISVYDPESGTSAIAQYTDASSLSVQVTDHPVIIQVTPSGTIATGGGSPTGGGGTTGTGTGTGTSTGSGGSTSSGSSTGNDSATTVGSGPDKLVLDLSADSYQGDPQFVVSVDGQQIGGVQTVSASHAAGATQEFDVLGNFGTGEHQADVTYLNDLYTPGVGDRNLYVDSGSFDGSPVDGAALTLKSNGGQSFDFSGGDSPITPETVGSGPDSLTLFASEDAFMGDAQFVVSVDGQQIGGVQTVSALHADGDTQALTLRGDFGTGAHTASVTFDNDLYTSGVGDRNLYITGAEANGSPVPGSALTLMYNHTESFAFGVTDS